MIKDKIKSLQELQRIVSAAKRRGEKIVFTNGCFDLLHLGHLRYLERASSLGDKLIVAVNNDSSVRRLKKNLRPLVPAKERASIVAGLGCVDYVIIFGQATPLKLIKALKPDLLVKGGDWRKNDIVGKEFVESYGGKVFSVDFVKAHSTSALIAKIRAKK